MCADPRSARVHLRCLRPPPAAAVPPSLLRTPLPGASPPTWVDPTGTSQSAGRWGRLQQVPSVLPTLVGNPGRRLW